MRPFPRLRNARPRQRRTGRAGLRWGVRACRHRGGRACRHSSGQGRWSTPCLPSYERSQRSTRGCRRRSRRRSGWRMRWRRTRLQRRQHQRQRHQHHRQHCQQHHGQRKHQRQRRQQHHDRLWCWGSLVCGCGLGGRLRGWRLLPRLRRRRALPLRVGFGRGSGDRWTGCRLRTPQRPWTELSTTATGGWTAPSYRDRTGCSVGTVSRPARTERAGVTGRCRSGRWPRRGTGWTHQRSAQSPRTETRRAARTAAAPVGWAGWSRLGSTPYSRIGRCATSGSLSYVPCTGRCRARTLFRCSLHCLAPKTCLIRLTGAPQDSPAT
ncbi:hypothetical protein EV646_11170 [Kribbella antiqua]|uniref:Uncharacterized protein n=1 Tax=Kribbella antiqua TaxID=2512217 RepID=A0A4R2IJ88_9ACTN|nr:hypothetical protein EV646_11170 [Kribbella antiqua]